MAKIELKEQLNIDKEMEVVIKEEAKINRKKYYSASDIMKIEFKEGLWLWGNYMPLHEISGITGPSDTGKSTLLRQLALAIVMGKEQFLGKALNTKHQSVLYISTEDGVRGIKQSLAKQLDSLDANPEALDRLYFFFDNEDLIDEIKNFLKENPVDLVIIDCYGDAFKGNPNDMTDVRDYMGKLRGIIHDYGCSFVILHHNVKNSEKGAPDKNKMNGSQALEAKMRSLIELRLGQSDNERLITLLKANYVSQEMKNKPQVLSFNPDSLTLSETDKEYDADNRQVKYDKDLWCRRFHENRCTSIMETVINLKDKFQDENVPSKTWFIENGIK